MTKPDIKFKELVNNLINESSSQKYVIKGSNSIIDFDRDMPNVVFQPPLSGVVEFATKTELKSVIKILNRIVKELPE